MLSCKFWKFFYDIYDCDCIIILKFITKYVQMEINPDPMKELSQSIRKSKNRVVYGNDFTAKMEILDDFHSNSLIQDLKYQA
jgi:hypothetical protein